MKFDLEERTTRFAKEVVKICRKIPRDSVNDRIFGQLVGSSGSIGANYREANDALGRKDFLMRIRIARKEAKEVIHWLEILLEANPKYKNEIDLLIKEATELKNILSKILNNCQK